MKQSASSGRLHAGTPRRQNRRPPRRAGGPTPQPPRGRRAASRRPTVARATAACDRRAMPTFAIYLGAALAEIAGCFAFWAGCASARARSGYCPASPRWRSSRSCWRSPRPPPPGRPTPPTAGSTSPPPSAGSGGRGPAPRPLGPDRRRGLPSRRRDHPLRPPRHLTRFRAAPPLLGSAPMSIWTRITEAIAAIVARGESLLRVFEPRRRPAEASVAFTIAILGLGAKMAKADGLVHAGEVAAFREVFRIAAEDEADAARVFNLAREDVAGYQAYATPHRADVPRPSARCSRTSSRACSTSRWPTATTTRARRSLGHRRPHLRRRARGVRRHRGPPPRGPPPGPLGRCWASPRDADLSDRPRPLARPGARPPPRQDDRSRPARRRPSTSPTPASPRSTAPGRRSRPACVTAQPASP